MKISQDIEIRTIAGVKFDMLAGETVEVVMGGFSLLDLSLRSANYTTSFKLPRTPVNESILEFASETTRYNRPNVAVYVRFGTKDMLGYMKVISFSNVYSVTITFTDFIKNMSGYTLNDIVADIVNPIYTNTTDLQPITNELQPITNELCDGATYTMFHHYSEDEFPAIMKRGIFINHAKVIDMICVKAGYTSSIAAGIDLSKVFLFCRDWYYEIKIVSANNYEINIKPTAEHQYKSISVLLKQICLLNGIYFTVNELTKIISFYSISALLENTPILIETLQLTEKQLYTGHGLKNNINYAVGDGILSTTKNAVFYSDGTTTKEALELEFLIPSKTDGNYSLVDVTDLVSASREGTASMIQYYEIQYYDVSTGYVSTGYLQFTTEWLTVPDLAPAYAFMSNVFAETNVIKAQGYINSLDVENIMQKRIIRSVGLGGIYFVETLNYNINTGNSVLTLIKL